MKEGCTQQLAFDMEFNEEYELEMEITEKQNESFGYCPKYWNILTKIETAEKNRAELIKKMESCIQV